MNIKQVSFIVYISFFMGFTHLYALDSEGITSTGTTLSVLDYDNDGISNDIDEDDDNDGISDILEIQYGLDPLDNSDSSTDLDGDGYSNSDEIREGFDPTSSASHPIIDNDGDGVDDRVDAFPEDSTEWMDTDGDGIGNNADPDDDNDGMSDDYEMTYLDVLNPQDASDRDIDSDGDGVTNYQEFLNGTNPSINIATDNDEDGVLNEQDAFPQDPTEQYDHDADGIGDNADPDDDNDGMSDDYEITYMLNQYDPSDRDQDTDGDGFTNYQEFLNGTDPQDPTNQQNNQNNQDDDGDGVPNDQDAFPQDPTEQYDYDADGIGDNADPDDDNDGMSDDYEITYTLNQYDNVDAANDNDGDGLTNYDEFLLGSNPMDHNDPKKMSMVLNTNWNLIGANINLSFSEIQEKIGMNNLLVIQGPEKSYKKENIDNGLDFLNDFTQFEEGKGYWIKVAGAVTIEYQSIASDLTIALQAGWNLINPSKELSLEEIKNQVGTENLITIQGPEKSYKKENVDNGLDFLNDFEKFEEPKGYWVNVKNSSQLNFK